MTGTKRLSLHGRLRMAAACPNPNAALLAEAADAIEQHEAFRHEVSDAVEDYCGYVPPDSPRHPITRFIIAKPDPLVEAVGEAMEAHEVYSKFELTDSLREALAKRGGKIVWGEAR